MFQYFSWGGGERSTLNIKLSPWVETKEGSALLGACSPGVEGDWEDGTWRKKTLPCKKKKISLEAVGGREINIVHRSLTHDQRKVHRKKTCFPQTA